MMTASEKKTTANKPRRNRTGKALAAPPPEPSAGQRKAFPAALEKTRSFAEPATVKVVHDEHGVGIHNPHNDLEGHTALLSTALGSRSEEWTRAGINHLITATHPKSVTDVDEVKLNTALAFMTDIAPRNTVEAALGMQMLATHETAMEMMRRARNADFLPQMEAYGNLATKLTRTFTTQMEALAKLRRGGEQVVKHVYVSDGGQAVFAGTINQGQKNGKADERSCEPGDAAASSAPLFGQDPEGNGVPLPSLEGQEAVPITRRSSGRSEGE